MTWRLRLAYAVFLIAAVLIVFPFPTVGGFVSDDWDWITAASTRSSVFPDMFTNYAGGTSGGSYNPVASLWINALYRIGGLNPLWYHLGNRLLHAANALLLAVLCGLVCRRVSHEQHLRFLPLCVGVFFLIMPQHTEAVMWIAAVPHLLATLFTLLALIFYILWRERGRYYYSAMLCASGMAFFSKEIALMIPIFLVGIEWWLHVSKSSRMRLRHTIPVLPVVVVACTYIILRVLATGVFFGTYAEGSMIVRPQQWVNTFGTFMVEFISFGTARVPWMQWYWQQPLFASVIVVAGVFSCSFLIMRFRMRSLSLWWTLYLVSLVPFVPLGFNRLSQEGERYTYLPSIFICVVLATLLQRFARKNFALILIVGIFFAVGGTMQRVDAWQTAYYASDSIVRDAGKLPGLRDPSRLMLFVGIPDTIGGAHVFRNNLAEAIRLTDTSVRAELVQLPVYTQGAEARDTVLAWTSDTRGLFGKRPDKDFAVTGFDRRETTYVVYELWNYDYKIFSSDTVRLIFTDTLWERVRRGEASVSTWNGAGLIDITPEI